MTRSLTSMGEESIRAVKKAMRLLEHMPRTEKGLTDRLIQEGFAPEAVQDALDYVRSFGYLNDRRYAESYISGRIGSKSRQRIMQELCQKGIDRETASLAWEEISAMEEPDEKAMICRQIEKKYPAGSRIEEKELRRLYGYLARRGFQAGKIFSALEELDITSEKQ